MNDEETQYRGYKIFKASCYVKNISGFEYEFLHDNYDIDDNRHGYAKTITEAMGLIDDLEAEK